MNKLKEFTKKIKHKWSELTKGKKIAFTIIPIGIIFAIIALCITVNAQKYGVLFSNMNDKDLGAILAKLKEKKVEYKVEGKAIKVPKEKVDVLRLELASEVPLTNGSVGFEIFDESKFGATDEEMKIKYQRAMEGELERTIKGLPEIDDAKVHLVMSQDSVFVKEDTPASASLTLRLKSGKELKKDQVKAIVALICGSVKNLDKKNVEIIASGDYGTTLLTTPDLFDEQNKEYLGNNQEQEKIKSSLEKSLESKIQAMLEKVYGRNNIVVKVNADLNFDAIQQNSTEFSPKGTVVSEHIITDNNNSGEAANTNSPVDDNMAAREETTKGSSNISHKEEKRNYEISKNEKKIIKAPGAVNKLTTSVLLNGNIDAATKSAVTNLVIGAVGYDEKRGDTISIEGMNFDKTVEDKAKKDIEAMEKLKEKERLKKIIMGSVVGAVLLLALIIALIIKTRKKKNEEEIDEEVKGLDVVIGNNIQPKEAFESINFEEDNEKTHLEKEIKNYATEKPEQVAEIVKSWLTEDER
ncbi:flagellar basal-body MS-ring/collar protein FliF [Haloimpatiens lingqiaonensis]|uniref:flagellar basal-body MS-ring/collar protein FliF n=1 Tax=Haloimpatiens lingqiaonensis TaxID=1380675 RepID=UPI0010FD0675|nr:flagellar basal-body MS-ring/collar protein FliF [Haloimpatiens lingqiaonensis]